MGSWINWFCDYFEDEDEDMAVDGSDSEEMSDSSLAEQQESQETIPVTVPSVVSVCQIFCQK